VIPSVLLVIRWVLLIQGFINFIRKKRTEMLWVFWNKQHILLLVGSWLDESRSIIVLLHYLLKVHTWGPGVMWKNWPVKHKLEIVVVVVLKIVVCECSRQMKHLGDFAAANMQCLLAGEICLYLYIFHIVLRYVWPRADAWLEGVWLLIINCWWHTSLTVISIVQNLTLELVMCEYSKFRIESNSYFSIWFDSKRVQIF